MVHIKDDSVDLLCTAVTVNGKMVALKMICENMINIRNVNRISMAFFFILVETSLNIVRMLLSLYSPAPY